MRIDDEEESTNFQDDRGSGGGGFGGFGGGGFSPIALGGGGLGAVVLVILGLLFGVNPAQLLGGGQGGAPVVSDQGVQPGSSPPSSASQSGPEDSDVAFSRRVLHMTERTWTEVLGERGVQYRPPTLVVYSEADRTGCGEGQSAMGPFYCPADQKLYLDLSFFQELSNRFGAPGRFAEAYVIAHEVGHHVQNLLGLSEKIDVARQQADRRTANQLSVRVELQADCYAGVWANRANRERNFLDPGDIDQGLRAASAVGDDTLQREMQGRVVPDAFTHGTSAQRVRWFKAGFAKGDMDACDTFSGDYAAL